VWRGSDNWNLQFLTLQVFDLLSPPFCTIREKPCQRCHSEPTLTLFRSGSVQFLQSIEMARVAPESGTFTAKDMEKVRRLADSL
jgi:hypothetical protein